MGFLIGTASSLAAVAVIWLVQTGKSMFLVRIFGIVHRRTVVNLRGVWKATWSVDSAKYPPRVTDEHAKIQQVGKRIYGTFHAQGSCFQLRGTLEAGRYITGEWYDKVEAGYSGAFQFVIDPSNPEQMSGMWIGYSTDGNVKFGSWDWQRNPLHDAPPAKPVVDKSRPTSDLAPS